MSRKSIDNLIFFSEVPPERMKEIATQGGIASGEARKKKKIIKEKLELLLSLPLKDKVTEEKLRELGVDEEEIDNKMAMVLSMWNKAISGDVQAFNSIRDSVGEKPSDVVENINYTKEEAEKYKKLTIEELKKLAGGK